VLSTAGSSWWTLCHISASRTSGINLGIEKDEPVQNLRESFDRDAKSQPDAIARMGCLVQSCVYAGSDAIALICRSRSRCGIDKMSNHIHIWRPCGIAMCCFIRLSQRNCRGDGTYTFDEDEEEGRRQDALLLTPTPEQHGCSWWGRVLSMIVIFHLPLYPN